MQRRLPDASAGFSRFDASIAPPLVAPAPITVWISSMNRIAPGCVLQLGHDRLQPLLEVAAIARAGEQRAHVERIDRGLRQHFRHVAFDDALGQALGDRGLADAGIADIERVVLGAAAKDLDGPLDLLLAADQRVDLARHRLLVQVHAVVRQRVLIAPVRLFLAFLLLMRSRPGCRSPAPAAARTGRAPWRCRG